MRRVQVRPQPRGALPQQPRLPVGRVEQIVQQLAAHPLFGLARRPAGELQQ